MTGGGGWDISYSGAAVRFFQNNEQIFGMSDQIYGYKDMTLTNNLTVANGTINTGAQKFIYGLGAPTESIFRFAVVENDSKEVKGVLPSAIPYFLKNQYDSQDGFLKILG
ncbi:hypothetical protein ACTJKC_24790 [Pedobacter sp. 22226]|uniref:hypothetical protein n=1 Tax=Pedobacter sp. 22226 TaxID=3453894 RepID=UPI003F84E25F